MGNELNAAWFLNWARSDRDQFQKLWSEILEDIILDLEEDDYFGTEGFDKRFA